MQCATDTGGVLRVGSVYNYTVISVDGIVDHELHAPRPQVGSRPTDTGDRSWMDSNFDGCVVHFRSLLHEDLLLRYSTSCRSVFGSSRSK